MIEILRVPLAVAAGICTLCGYILAAGGLADGTAALLLFVAVMTIASGTMPINDLIDRDADLVNRPDRPIPSGRVKPWQAVALSVVLSAIGVACAFAVGRAVGFAALGLVVLATFYNLRGKKLGIAGNTMVSLCVSSTFSVGALARGWPPHGLPLTLTAVAFLASLALETAGDIHDAAGDRENGSRSFAVTRGSRAAAMLYVALCLIVSTFSVALPLLLPPTERMILSVTAPTGVAFLGTAFVFVRTLYGDVETVGNANPQSAESAGPKLTKLIHLQTILLMAAVVGMTVIVWAR